MKKAFEEQDEGDAALFARGDGMLLILGVFIPPPLRPQRRDHR
jgi:hypothetical protein